MKTRTSIAIVLGLQSTALAQNHVTSPLPRYLKEEGQYTCTYLGENHTSRHQLLDGNLRGPARTLREVAMRADGRNPYSRGRRWSAVSLVVAHSDLATASKTFASNVKGTPTLAFQGGVLWPELTGQPPTTPAPWSYRFPFKTPFKYDGKQDLCLDFAFAGGTLTNGKPWYSSSYLGYRLDSYQTGFTGSWDGVQQSAGNCADTSNSKARSWISCYSYADSGQNEFRIEFAAWGLGLNAPTTVVFGASSKAMTFPGVTCQKLYVDLRVPPVIHSGRANAHGTYGFHKIRVKYAPALTGIPFTTQAAWNDTANGALHLSAAVASGLAHFPYFANDIESKRLAYQSTSTSASTATFISRKGLYNPILRYTY